MLQSVGVFPKGEAADVVARLKVLAELLTYHTDVPQEGRIREKHDEIEMRVSTFPTLHGERAVIRLFATQQRFQFLEDLGFPDEIDRSLRRLLGETSGVMIDCGPGRQRQDDDGLCLPAPAGESVGRGQVCRFVGGSDRSCRGRGCPIAGQSEGRL